MTIGINEVRRNQNGPSRIKIGKSSINIFLLYKTIMKININGQEII